MRTYTFEKTNIGKVELFDTNGFIMVRRLLDGKVACIKMHFNEEKVGCGFDFEDETEGEVISQENLMKWTEQNRQKLFETMDKNGSFWKKVRIMTEELVDANTW